jgi:O-methyltransferase involved in polyketide biosynthesis
VPSRPSAASRDPTRPTPPATASSTITSAHVSRRRRTRGSSVIGAGFDTRPFRLRGGRWIEVDEPQVLAAKEPRLPSAGCPNPLLRLPVDFETSGLSDVLAPHADGGPVFVVVEGVIMYLGEDGLRSLLRSVRRLFPNAEVGCDLMSRAFFGRFARRIHDRIRDVGASFRLPPMHPSVVFETEGFTALSSESIQARAVQEGVAPWFTGLAMRLLPELRDGYRIWVFGPR